MAWIEAHQSLGDHPKLKKAARLLGVPRVQLVGHLFYLWWWAIDYAPSGDVTDYDPSDLADAARWEGDAEAFVQALIDSRVGERPGFLERLEDGRLLIHDWWEYAGKLVQRRRDDAERKRRERTSDRRPSDGPADDGAPPPDVRTPSLISSADVPGTSNGRPQDVLPHTTDTTQQDQPDPPDEHPSGVRAPADAADAAPDALSPPVQAPLKLRTPRKPPAEFPTTRAVQEANKLLRKRCDEVEREAINAAIPDGNADALELWVKVLKAWHLKYPTNKGVSGPLDWFRSGGPPPPRPPNGTYGGSPPPGGLVHPNSQRRNPGPERVLPEGVELEPVSPADVDKALAGRRGMKLEDRLASLKNGRPPEPPGAPE